MSMSAVMIGDIALLSTRSEKVTRPSAYLARCSGLSGLSNPGWGERSAADR